MSENDEQVDAAEQAFAEMVRGHLPMIRQYAARRVPADDVDDVTSEVFAAAWIHRTKLPEDPRFWLLRTAWFHVQHNYRQQRRHERVTTRLARLRSESSDDLEAGAVDGVLVRAALAKLPDSDQEVLRLAAWEGLEPAEIAEVLGSSRVSVRVRLHRARKRLARLLGDQFEELPTIFQTPASAERTR